MKMTEKEKGIRMELAKNETKLKAVQDRLQFLWRRGKKAAKENVVSEAIKRLLPVHFDMEEYKVLYENLRKEFKERDKKNEKERDALCCYGDTSLRYNKEMEKTRKEVWNLYWEQYKDLQKWYLKETEKINLSVEEYFLQIESSAVRFLLAYYAGAIPKDRDYRLLYEGSGYEDNLRQIAWEKRLGISEFFADGVYSDGDRYHGYKEDAFLYAVKAVDPDMGVEYVQIPAEIERLEKSKFLLVSEIENLASFLRGYETLRRFGQDTAAIEKKMPWLIKAVADTFNLQDMQVSVDSRIAVLLSHLSFTHHGPGVEYGSLISVFRDGREKQEYFMFRSPNSESEDKPFNRFEKCLIVSVTASAVTVQLDSDHAKKTIKFSLSKKGE